MQDRIAAKLYAAEGGTALAQLRLNLKGSGLGT